MSLVRKLLLVGALGVAGLIVWVWWNRPQPVDMAEYIPADTVIYMEANSLPDVLSGLVSTDAWHRLAPPAGVRRDFGQRGWLASLVKWTGLGPMEAVVFTRAQVAVAVLDFKTEEVETGSTLKITPRAALVAETHTSRSRARAAAEKLIGDLARRTYGAPRFSERTEADETSFLMWTSPTEANRKIVVAVSESLVIVGNDETVVEACLAARRGARPALAADQQLREMRERMSAGSSLSFGYVPRASAAKLLEVTALAYIGQMSADPRMQSMVASLLPQLANRVLSHAAWSARVRQGAMEDSYFFALQNGVGGRLNEALAPASEATTEASALLPPDIYQLSRYSYREPLNAWRGLNVALATQLDALSAPFVSKLLEEALKPYGIEAPREFLSAAGSEMLTARLDDSGASTVLVVSVRDRAALEKQLRRRLGTARKSMEGEAELLVSEDEERGAGAFIKGFLIMGRESNVRRCLAAQAQGQTLSASERYRQAQHRLFESAPAVTTFSDDREPARAFINYFSKQKRSSDAAANAETYARAVNQLPLAVSESRFAEDGMERRTRSAFGNFGVLVTRFAPEKAK